jgi:MerR family transcriptional regulator, light-induced transcriptional regulator
MSLDQAAERLGVHYMTVYRYVRTGRLNAEHDGARWLVDPADVERLMAGPVRRPRGRARAEAGQLLTARLLAADEPGSWAVVESALASGAEPADVLMDVVAPAMDGVGRGWADGSLDVADEHRATAIAQRIIARLGPRFLRRGRKRGVIVMGAPAGEQHSIPGAMLADLLRAARYEVHDLGADTPAESFAVAAASTQRLAAVMVGVTTPGHDRPAAHALRELRRAGIAVPLFIGGRAIHDEAHAHRLGADHWSGRDGRHAVEIVERVLGSATKQG